MLFRSLSRSFAVVVACASALCGSASAQTKELAGAGSSAAAPVYKVWAAEYAKVRGGESLTYAAVGSSAGMAKVRSREVDFGGSDIVGSAQELERDGLVMIPTVVTGIVPVVNLPQVSNATLKLSGEVLAAIFLGSVTRWDADAIKALNPGMPLPALPIRRVVREDGSGTTFHFTDYLSRVSPDWKTQHGVANKVQWKGEVLAAKGSADVAKTIRSTVGSIGYIDYNYVLDDGLVGVALRNADGQFVTAGPEGFREAVSRSDWYAKGDFLSSISNSAGARSWPITMGTFVAVPRVAKQTDRAERALRFITWSYLNGDALAREARFVPLPTRVQANAYREISKITGAAGEPLGAKVLSSLMK
ncbi:phosphate ABC transporter substrate-binding protein PstS [Ideonella sp. DXS29W]|uniref:Phosphate-binding protein PstS n=1 Tax=Ideonella lacteola TaxID=2984193 RepID=A0ABU9C2G7_9BURK